MSDVMYMVRLRDGYRARWEGGSYRVMFDHPDEPLVSYTSTIRVLCDSEEQASRWVRCQCVVLARAFEVVRVRVEEVGGE